MRVLNASPEPYAPSRQPSPGWRIHWRRPITTLSTPRPVRHARRSGARSRYSVVAPVPGAAGEPLELAHAAQRAHRALRAAQQRRAPARCRRGPRWRAASSRSARPRSRTATSTPVAAGGQAEAPAAGAARRRPRAGQLDRHASPACPCGRAARTVPVTRRPAVRRIQPATTLEPAESATPSSSAAGRGRGQGSQTAACACPAWSSWRGGSGNATRPATAATTASPSHGSLRHSVQWRRSTRLAARRRPAAAAAAAARARSSPPRSAPTTTILTASSAPVGGVPQRGDAAELGDERDQPGRDGDEERADRDAPERREHLARDRDARARGA